MLPTKLTQHELYQQSRIFEKGFPFDQVSKRLQRALNQNGSSARRIYTVAYTWDGKRYSAYLCRDDGRVYIYDHTFERYQTLYVEEPPGLIWMNSSTRLAAVINRWWLISLWWMPVLKRMMRAFGKWAWRISPVGNR